MVAMKLELVPLPVADVDRAKRFYVDQVGFAEDVDVRPFDGLRVVQLTPPGSACSIGFGHGAPVYDDLTAGAVRLLHMVVDGIDAARDALIAKGVDVTPVHDVGGGVLYAEFADPDGNTWALQEMPWRTGGAY